MMESDFPKINLTGWLVESKNISTKKSPNFDARPKKEKVSLLVLHCISLPPGRFGGENVEKLFLNNLDTSKKEFSDLKKLRVSSHFFIKRDGNIVQFVSTHKRAWHAGTSSFMGRSNCNNFSIGIELEGTEFTYFEKEQYDSLSLLAYSISKVFPSIAHITGHEHIAPSRKTDPGPFLDWKLLEKNFRELSIPWEFFYKKK